MKAVATKRKVAGTVFGLLLSSYAFGQATNLNTGDAIVTGSLGIGNDATTNINFGSNTLYFRENNLRIFFEDNSTMASFPSNDWQILINDDVNGGSNYFAVRDATGGQDPFKVMAGADNNALYVAANNRIGFGTNSPATLIHGRNGNTPALRLEQDGSVGWTPYIWDLAGNETNFFIRDVSAGSRLPFRMRPGAPTNALTIQANGSIGMGTWTPDANAALQLSSTTQGFLMNRLTSAQATTLAGSLDANDEGLLIYQSDTNDVQLWSGTQWESLGRQTLSLSGNTLNISTVSSPIDLTPYLDNTDNQDLSLSGNILSLTNDASTVDLSAYLDNTDTQLTEAQVDAFVANNGFLTSFTEVDGDVTNELQNLSITGNTLSMSNSSATVDLSAYLDNTDTQLTEAQVDAFVANNGFLTSFTEVDGDVTNELQNLSITGNTLSMSNSSATVDLSAYLDNTDTQLTEAQVDAFVANNGFLTSFTEVDGDVTNELQDLSITGNTLSMSNSSATVDLSTYLDNTDNQNLANVLSEGNDAGGALIQNIQDPVNPQDAATKAYVDALQTLINDLEARVTYLEGCACDSTAGIQEPGGSGGFVDQAILYQNIPNPFNNTSIIKYYLPAHVNGGSIVFSNSIGQIVSTTALTGSGYGQININASDLPAGTYYYTLYVNQSPVDTKTMIVQ